MAWGAYRAKAESAAASHYFSSWSVRRKLLSSLIPSILLILIVAGYVTNWFSSRYLNTALERTAQVQNLAQAREIELMLEDLRLSLLNLTHQRIDRDTLANAIVRWNAHHPGSVRELAFVGVSPAETLLLVQTDTGVVEIGRDEYASVKGNPIPAAQKLRGLKPGAMPFSDLVEAVYPPSALPGQKEPLTTVVFRLMTPVPDGAGGVRGFLSLGVEARAVRNILSLYNSPKSPLYAFARTSETRFSYFFDDQGWILFQSENYEEPDRELSAETARLGMTGDYGLPDFGKAFRPLPTHESYWRMVVDVQAGRPGVNDMDLPSDSVDFLSPRHFMVYAPVRFMENPEKGPTVIGGVAYIDRSRLTDAAEFRHLDVMLIITISGMGLVAIVIFFISRAITSPMHRLAAEIRTMFEEKKLHPIRLDSRDLESGLLTRAINRMIQSLQEKQEQIRRRDEQIHKVQQREKVSFDNETPTALGWRLVGEIPDLIGQSPQMANLQGLIRKAAGTDADVLVVGETGTGKELTAEAIHKFSARASKPFISINCGGLDENLLMDTLFGHVKGAFTEAKSDRKGAFLASDGGTLFLDEIGTATLSVQKALLRALSVRRIRPLGSDQEMEFNVRVIAATNVDLMEMVHRGEFRDDLYYRLKVIFIQVPPLRQRKEDIPILANHFLQELAASTGRDELGLSRGALEKLMAHDWPGNVRELKNCITRAHAFAEGELLYAEDLLFDEDADLELAEPVRPLRPAPQAGGDSAQRSYSIPVVPGPVAEDAAPAPGPVAAEPLGDREGRPRPRGPLPGQRPEEAGGEKSSFGADGDLPAAGMERAQEEPATSRARTALRLARERGSFTRLEYQQAIGAGISQRTAQYDLTSLVKAGRLRKTGKGPSTQYLLP